MLKPLTTSIIFINNVPIAFHIIVLYYVVELCAGVNPVILLGATFVSYGLGQDMNKTFAVCTHIKVDQRVLQKCRSNLEISMSTHANILTRI